MVTNGEPDHLNGRTQMHATDSEVGGLAELARAGDRASFEQFVNLFNKQIFRMVYYRTSSRMDAEDLTQEIFVKAFNSISTLRDVHCFRPWLYMIAVNKVRDFHRKKRILVFFGAGSEEKVLEPTDRQRPQNSQVLDRLIKQEFWQQVKDFSGTLSRWEKEVFLLRFFDQLSIAEIAQALQKSESAVKTHLYRSLRKIKDSPGVVRLLEAHNT